MAIRSEGAERDSTKQKPYGWDHDRKSGVHRSVEALGRKTGSRGRAPRGEHGGYAGEKGLGPVRSDLRTAYFLPTRSFYIG